MHDPLSFLQYKLNHSLYLKKKKKKKSENGKMKLLLEVYDKILNMA